MESKRVFSVAQMNPYISYDSLPFSPQVMVPTKSIRRGGVSAEAMRDQAGVKPITWTHKDFFPHLSGEGCSILCQPCPPSPSRTPPSPSRTPPCRRAVSPQAPTAMSSVSPQPRAAMSSVLCRTSTASLWGQCSLPDLNCDLLCPVFLPDLSAQCSLPDLRAQCTLPDLNLRTYVRKNVRRYVRKNVRRYVSRYARKNVRKKVRNVGRCLRKTCRMNVRTNVRCQKACHVCVFLCASCVLCLYRVVLHGMTLKENKYGGFACFEMPWWGSLQVK